MEFSHCLYFFFLSQVDKKYQHGDTEGAESASRKALWHSQRGILAGIVIWGVLLIVTFIGVLMGMLYAFDYIHSYRPS